MMIEVRGLHYFYEDGTHALRGIDFDLARGGRVALLGANGSGKTTFVHHLNGILRGSGTITVDGLPVDNANLREIRRRVGLVFQDSDNQLFLSNVLEDVAFGPMASGMPAAQAAERARSALDRVGLLHKAQKAPWHLSAGEKKRAAIAGILAMEAQVLVLDEPTTFLDPPARRSLAQLLDGLTQTIVLVTHNIQFAQSLTNDAVFFEDGRITARGPVQQIAESVGW